MNCVGAVKLARQLGPGHTIVTILCDGGHRHLSKFHSPTYLESVGLTPVHSGRGLEFVLEGNAPVQSTSYGNVSRALPV